MNKKYIFRFTNGHEIDVEAFCLAGAEEKIKDIGSRLKYKDKPRLIGTKPASPIIGGK